MQLKNLLPMAIQPSPRTCVFNTDLLARLPVVLILWSAFILLTGCKRPYSSLAQENPGLGSCYMVNWHDLTMEYTEETFEQFLTQRGATAIWNRLCYEVDYTQFVDPSIVHTDRAISDMLLKHALHEQAELKAGMIGYIQRRNQETAFRYLLQHNGLDAVWKRLNEAKGKDALDLYAMLRNCTPLVQSHVLKGVFYFIGNHCPKLVELNLCSNNLTTLPDSFRRLIQLRKVNLSYNQLEVLPDSFGNLVNLNELYLHENQLTQLPDSFGSLRDLQKLDLFDNKLTVLPDSFGNLTQLQRLKLTCNQLITLPKSFGNLINLNELSLAYNQLTTLPDCFGNLINLNDLNLYKNQLQVLPGCLQKLTKLRVFTVKKNLFLQPNATLQDTHILVTRANLKLKPFPRQEYVRQHSLNSTFNYDFNREIFELTRPDDSINYIRCTQVYPVILFIKKLGQATLSQPVPICLDLSGKQIVDHVYSQIQVIIIDK